MIARYRRIFPMTCFSWISSIFVEYPVFKDFQVPPNISNDLFFLDVMNFWIPRHIRISRMSRISGYPSNFVNDLFFPDVMNFQNSLVHWFFGCSPFFAWVCVLNIPRLFGMFRSSRTPPFPGVVNIPRHSLHPRIFRLLPFWQLNPPFWLKFRTAFDTGDENSWKCLNSRQISDFPKL